MARSNSFASEFFGVLRRIRQLLPFDRHRIIGASHIEEALASDEFLKSVCDCGPKVYELPFKKSETEKFVIVWPHLRDGALNHRNLFQTIQASIRIPYDKSFLRKYVGIEIVPYVGENLAGEGRVVRVSVTKHSLAQVLTLQAGDLIGQEIPGYAGWHATPIEGVRVSWYRNPSEISE